MLVSAESGNKPIASRRVASQAVNYQLILLIVVSDRLNHYNKIIFFSLRKVQRLAQVRRCQTSRLLLLSRRRNFYVSHRWRSTPHSKNNNRCSALRSWLIDESLHFTRRQQRQSEAKTKKKKKKSILHVALCDFSFSRVRGGNYAIEFGEDDWPGMEVSLSAPFGVFNSPYVMRAAIEFSRPAAVAAEWIASTVEIQRLAPPSGRQPEFVVI